MLRKIDNYFEDIIDDRLDDIEGQVADNNKKIQNLRKDYRELLIKVIKLIPKEDKNLIFIYEEKRNQAEMLYLQIIYKQGLADGLRIGNMFNEIRNKDIVGL